MIEQGDRELMAGLYKRAENKGEQILIFTELYLVHEDAVIEVLKELGVFKESDLDGCLRTCTGCGRRYIARTMKGKALCPQCAYRRRKARELAQIKARKKERAEERWKKDREEG